MENNCNTQYFKIGITGHKSLDPLYVPSVIEEIKLFFTELQMLHKSKSILVLSSLAEGADILCAKTALDIGLKLVVPLPMNISEYRKDFSDTSAFEFNYFISSAHEIFVVSPKEPLPKNPSRGFYYRQAGIYIANNCDIMLALWNGIKKDTSDGAGTYETIKLAKKFKKEIKIIKINKKLNSAN